MLGLMSVSKADIYAVQNLPTTYYAPDKDGVIHPWCQTVYVPYTTQTLPAEPNFSNYIKKPYHDPNLIAKQQEQEHQQAIAQARQLEEQEKEHSENMQQICANFVRSHRMRGFGVMDQQVHDREIMSFKKFAESCTDYVEKNRLIYSGLNPQEEDTDLKDTTPYDHDLDDDGDLDDN